MLKLFDDCSYTEYFAGDVVISENNSDTQSTMPVVQSPHISDTEDGKSEPTMQGEPLLWPIIKLQPATKC